MTDEEILAAAEACGIFNDCLDVETVSFCILAFGKFVGKIERFKEREACAKVCEDIEAQCIAEDSDDPPLHHIASAIRARGEA